MALEGIDYKVKYEEPGPQEEDINTMHRYRDAIVHRNSNNYYERDMYGAYVLFPYKQEDKFKEHHFYKSIADLNIGGLPFLPGETKLAADFLRKLIDEDRTGSTRQVILPAGMKVDYTVNGAIFERE